MKVLVTGIDGYTGWPLALHLLSRGHEVVGIDNFITRARVREVGGISAIPIPTWPRRAAAAAETFHRAISFHRGDMGRYEFVDGVLREEKPDAIVHLAEQRSAPYSMIDVHHAVRTQTENLTGTLHLLYAMREHLPHAHLVKMGTMGEYGTPNVEIPEGFFEIEYKGRKDRLPFPRQAGSWYHWSKVFDSGDVQFASKIWGLRSTDVMQGVVYGIHTPEMTSRALLTRFDFDEVWGTALNRFCVEALLGLPITPYGEGNQIRGFIALEDSVQSLRIAIENPPAEAEYRVWNQFDAAYSVNHLAEEVRSLGEELGLHPVVEHPADPRVEAERHFYAPVHEELPAHGYRRSRELRDVLREILKELGRHRQRIEARREALHMGVSWRSADNRPRLAVPPPREPSLLPSSSPPASTPPEPPS